MWEVIYETRLFPSSDGMKPVKVLGVKREDGFKVIRELQDDWPYYEKSGDEAFSCHGSLGSSKFTARRRKGGKETNTYEVSLLTEGTSDPELCRAYAKDIEFAFLEGWPWDELFENYKKSALKYGIHSPTFTPLESVLFWTGLSEGPVSAEDLQYLMYTRGFDKEFQLALPEERKWQLVSERRIYRTVFELEEVERPYDIIGIQREDGFRLTLEGITDDHIEIFQVKTETGEGLKFSLKRWKWERIAPRHVLCLYWFYPTWPGNAVNNGALCRSYYADIQDALLNFPLLRTFPAYVPVNQVAFQVGENLIFADGAKQSECKS